MLASRLAFFSKYWLPVFALFIPLTVAASGGIWTMKTYLDQQAETARKEAETSRLDQLARQTSAEAQSRIDQERADAQSRVDQQRADAQSRVDQQRADDASSAQKIRLIEAQRPYLEAQLQTYLDTSKTVGVLLSEKVSSEKFAEAYARLRSLVLVELPMLTNCGVAAPQDFLNRLELLRARPDRYNHDQLESLSFTVAEELKQKVQTQWTLQPEENIEEGCGGGDTEAGEQNLLDKERQAVQAIRESQPGPDVLIWK